MSFLEKYNRIKLENKGKIVLLKSGVFYIALGIDAYLLNAIIGLKLTKFGSINKVGIPETAVEKYNRILEEYDIPYIMHNGKEVIYSNEGNFEFVQKSKKIKKFIEIFDFKNVALECIEKYCSGNLGEVL